MGGCVARMNVRGCTRAVTSRVRGCDHFIALRCYVSFQSLGVSSWIYEAGAKKRSHGIRMRRRVRPVSFGFGESIHLGGSGVRSVHTKVKSCVRVTGIGRYAGCLVKSFVRSASFRMRRCVHSTRIGVYNRVRSVCSSTEVDACTVWTKSGIRVRTVSRRGRVYSVCLELRHCVVDVSFHDQDVEQVSELSRYWEDDIGVICWLAVRAGGIDRNRRKEK